MTKKIQIRGAEGPGSSSRLWRSFTKPTIKSTRKALAHRYGMSLFAYIAAGVVTGMACVAFMRGFELFTAWRWDFARVGNWAWITTPGIIVFSVFLVRRLAPCAAGTGIPQALFAALKLNPATEKRLHPLLSPGTMAVKIASLYLGVLVGASTGREGPTVHIAACVFLAILLMLRKLVSFTFDHSSVVVAGASAGLAAAFNTPLAGVTFAIEEMTVTSIGGIKDYVLMAVIVAALAAKSLTGEYTYFGRLLDVQNLPLRGIVVVGVAGGLLGSLFCEALIRGQKFFSRLMAGRRPLLVPGALGLCLAALYRLGGSTLEGAGNVPAQEILRGVTFAGWVPFPLTKMVATLLTYWSGIAGGIFAPCLSIGSCLGADLGTWIGVPASSCALVGMAAFLSGTIQAPITAFVIIFEMTGQHSMLLPIMLGSLVAFMTARLLGAQHFYQTLSNNYASMLAPKARNKLV